MAPAEENTCFGSSYWISHCGHSRVRIIGKQMELGQAEELRKDSEKCKKIERVGEGNTKIHL